MRAASRCVVAVCLIVFVAACGDGPRLAALAPHDRIVAFGDSLTYGTGAGPDAAYPAVLAALTGRTVVNAGVPGDTTQSALERLPGVLDAHRPRLVLLCLGGNDMLRKTPPSLTESNLRSMIETIRSHGAQVVLIGVPAPRLFGGPPEFYARIADDLDLPLESEVFDDVLRDNRLKSDPIHANAAGYRVVAERLAAFLDEAGAL